jgi:hypothetical protein
MRRHPPAQAWEVLSKTVECEPRRWKIVEHVREKFSCRNCEAITEPPTSSRPIPRGLAEQLVKRHGYELGYTVTKLNLHAAGLVKPACSRSAHRKKRQRRPLPGMMLHQAARATSGSKVGRRWT